MKQITTVDNMRRSDAATVAAGTPARELMARAGREICAHVSFRPPVAIVCGSGNNAGDGYVVAELLQAQNISCRIFLLEERFSDEGRYYFDRCRTAGVPAELCREHPDFSGYATVFDCLFGTGFHGKVEGVARRVIEAINKSGAYVVSADINSGLNGDSGMAELCVHSDLTVSLGDYKSGHFLGIAKDVIRQKLNCPIGIGLLEPPFCLAEAADLRRLFAGRKHFSNKGDYGYVALIGGSVPYSGAIKLATLSCSALRAGAGVAKLAAPASLAQAVLPYLLESTFFPLSEREGAFYFCAEEIDALLSHTRAVAVGMGMGRSEEGEKLLTHLLTHYDGRLVIDADGLNLLAGLDRQLLRGSHARLILTPHLKEFERLSGIPMAEMLRDPVSAVREYARAVGAIVLLKGPTTIVTDGKTTWFVDRGSPGMATAGSGDVLSGILTGICGFVPDGDLLLGVTAGAYLNGRAGELAAEAINPVSMLSGDTVGQIGAAVSEILQAEQ